MTTDTLQNAVNNLQHVDLSKPEAMKILTKILSEINFMDVFMFCFDMVLLVVICIAFFMLIDKGTKKLTVFLRKKQYDSLFVRFMPLITKLLKFFVILFIILIWGGSHGLNLTSIVTGIGIGGLAIGIAAKETIADLFGTVTLIADKAAKVGDIVLLDQSIDGAPIMGIIEDISLRSTKVRTFDGAINTIPNHILASNVIKNLTTITRRRIVEYVDIIYETKPEKIKEAISICKEILANHPLILETSLVELKSLTASSLRIMLRMDIVRTSTLDDLEHTRTDIFLQIIERFNKANIEFAYNTQTLYLKNTDK